MSWQPHLYYPPANSGQSLPPASQAPIEQYQPIRTPQPARPARRSKQRRGGLGCCGCFGFGLLLVVGLALAYFFAPLNTRVLLLGIDRAPEGTALSRTDTMILTSINPLMPTVKMLSIPRDLWISIPEVGENRINTIHFFAESVAPGSGPRQTVRVVSDTFGVRVRYYARLRFDGVVQIVDAMGGVVVNLPEAMSGYPAGSQRLTGEQALAFARDRAGTDDFFRMARGQLLIKAVAKQLFYPVTWVRLPQIIAAFASTVDTNVPFWHWPRLGLALARSVLQGNIDSRAFDRAMAAPFVTQDGASVLLPNWELINPLVNEMFGR